MQLFRTTIRFLVTAAAVFPATVTAQTRRSHPNVDGVWKMDTTKFEKHDRVLTGLVLHVSHLGDTLLVVTDVQDNGAAAGKMTARHIAPSLIGGSCRAFSTYSTKS